MKAVLISIHPRHCGNIASGKKTVEVRKTRPNLEMPFKVYIYCTSVKSLPLEEYVALHASTGGLCDKWSGRVIGEFVCDEIEKFTVGGLRCDDIEALACLTYKEMIAYFYKPDELNGKHAKFGYCWHTSDLKIYDKPKELSEFTTPFCLYEVAKCKVGARLCKHFTFKDALGGECDYAHRVTRPPQSWCYVEELEDDDEEAERIRADRLRDERRDEAAFRQIEGGE